MKVRDTFYILRNFVTQFSYSHLQLRAREPIHVADCNILFVSLKKKPIYGNVLQARLAGKFAHAEREICAEAV